VSAAGRRRVDAALTRTGLLLVQGQAEIPSVADLLAGGPVTTRGYSWDYAPAWNLTAEYEHGRDVAVVKLFRGRRTLVHRRLWGAVDALARDATARVMNARPQNDAARFLAAVDRQPGVPMSELRAQLHLDRRVFDRTKRNLEQWLCLLAHERDDLDYHTHEPALSPWSAGLIARTHRRRRPLAVDDAVSVLRDAVAGADSTAAARLFPVLRAGGR
jgi:hypothetical protein